MEEDVKGLIKRYQKGTCTQAEKLKVEAWLDMRSRTGEWTWTEQERNRIGEAIKKNIDKNLSRIDNVRYISNPMWAAACIIFFIAVGMWYYQTPILYNIVSVPAGQKKQLELSDGSVVSLNGATKFKYPKKFWGDTREVTLLEGEAFFNVKHDEKSFLVNSGSALIQVLGTSFNIRAYNFDSTIEVAVAIGKVAVKETVNAEENAGRIVLLQNDLVTINKRSGVMTKTHVDTRDAVSWLDGKLIFNGKTLANIALVLQYTYGVNISFSDKRINQIKCTAVFDKTDSIEDIILALSRANNLDYSIKDQTISFAFKKKKLYN